MFRMVILPEAKADIRNASIWYEKKQKGLGKRFIVIIRKCFLLLKTNPNAFQIRYDDIRTIITPKFPFMIHFSINEISKKVIIISVLHTSRNPESWYDINDTNSTN